MQIVFSDVFLCVCPLVQINFNSVKWFYLSSGFPLNEQLFQMIIRRYSDDNGNMDFDNYIGCLVRLDAMCRKSKRDQS